MIRLQKYMSECGIASRRKSEELITEGKVSVNGEVIKELGFKVEGNEEIIVNGELLKKENKEYFLLYKPFGVVSTVKDDKDRTTVIDLIKSNKKLYPVGRLDYDTTGLILITNDGELTNLLTHPSKDIPKVYEVKINGLIQINELKELENGIILDGLKTKKCKVKLKKLDKKNKKSFLTVTLYEGRNHEVKNMFEYFGYKVLKLKRTKFAFLDLIGMSEGEYKKLTPKDVKKLYNMVK